MFDCILLMAGTGRRSKLEYNKVLHSVNGKPLFMYSLEKFLNIPECLNIILVINKVDLNEIMGYIKDLKTNKISTALGGSLRQDSVLMGLQKVKSEIVLVHDAARPFVNEEDILAVYKAAKESGSATLAAKTIDTIKIKTDLGLKTLDRTRLWNIQTPQGADSKRLENAIRLADEEGYVATDDASLLEKYYNIDPVVVEGDVKNIKITTNEDVKYFEYLVGGRKMDYKIGHSHDTHKLVAGRKLILGGVKIDYHLGLEGHSDADVVYHVVSESIIGALGLGDLGMHFSDTDIKYKGMNSSFFLEEARKLMDKHGYEVNNLDVTIFVENIFMREYLQLIKVNIAKLLNTKTDKINIKATRREGLGYIGRGEGISSEAVILLKKGC